MTRVLHTILFLSIVINVSGQSNPTLEGKFEYKVRQEYYSTFYFSSDNFTYIQAGDLGAFYGVGKFKLDRNLLILTFDTLNLDRKKLKNLSIIDPKVDSLTLKTINKKGFEIEHPLDRGYEKKYWRRK